MERQVWQRREGERKDTSIAGDKSHARHLCSGGTLQFGFEVGFAPPGGSP
jgi:hypothetical protein